MKSFQDDFDRFEKAGAQVMGVSGDSLETHRDFSDELGLAFPLISDDGTLKKLYGSGRITYLIDTSGVIRFIHKGMPDTGELLKELNKL